MKPKPLITTWFKILKVAVSLNGFRQYIFYLSNLDVYRFIEYSNTMSMIDKIKNKNVIVELGAGYSVSPLLCNSKVLDINRQSCNWQKKNGIDSTIADMCNIPFKTNSVNIIVAISSIEHVPDDRKVYIEINRILKDDGYLIVSVPYSPEKSYVIKGLRKGIAVKLLNSTYLEKFIYFKGQTKTDFLNKVYCKDELFTIVKEENWKIEEEIIFGNSTFRLFFKIFPPGWFVLKDLIFGFFLYKNNTTKTEDGNTILLKIRKGVT